MPEYQCRVGAPDGTILEVQRLAASEAAVRRELSDEGFHIFAIKRGTRSGLPFAGRHEKVASKDFLLFNTQLKTLLRAGLPLAQSLQLLSQQQTAPTFKAMLEKVHTQVTTGVALSDAFAALGDAFPRLYANSIRAGERSGELDSVLERFVEYQRLVENVRRKIVGALTYPAVLILMSVVLIVVLVVKVIPEFSKFYDSFGAELPLPTVIVLGISDFAQANIVWLVVVGIAGAFGLRAWRRTPTGRRFFDRLALRIPLAGRLGHLFSLSQFARSMSLLLGGGTPMVPALETAATSVNNVWLSELFLGCVAEVREGRALSEALEDTGQAPGLALAMIRVGEGTGALPEMLEHTSDFFDEEIEFALSQIVTLFEPIILIVMGLIVAGLLLAVYYPLLSLVTEIG
jgi:type IV pilus assembly protein PilC